MRNTAHALLSTEITKLKRTSTFWISILFPTCLLVVALLDLLETFYTRTPVLARPLQMEWETVFRGWWTLWAMVAVPILVAVEAAGLESHEHSGKHWKQIYALPIPRWSVFAAKTTVCGLLVAGSFLIFSAGILGLGLLRSGLFHLHLASGVPWGLMLRVAGRAYLASAALIAIQTWLSIRFSGFATPVGTALAAIMLGSIMEKLHLLGWWPWTMAFDSLPWGAGHVPTSLTVSPAAFVLITVLAAWRLSQSEVT